LTVANRWAFVSRDGARDEHGVGVVIDVMRAFTVAAWAFHLGAEKIVLLDDLDEALALKAVDPGSLAFRDGPLTAGFELANSPVRIERLDVRGRTIYQRTSAGTRAAVAAAHLEPLFCAAFATAPATAAALRRMQGDRCVFVISGDGGNAAEDVACARYIAALVDEPTTSADRFVEAARTSKAANDLSEVARRGSAGVDPRDVTRWLECGRFDFVMRARRENGLLTLRRAGLI
jgi:2-phosphosulfolactate phosphatase